jgi:hypothetical protein
MAQAHFIKPTAPTNSIFTARLGAGSGSANQWTTAEAGKFAKLAGESRYDLCAVGDQIEGNVFAVELAPQNDYTIGSIAEGGTLNVTFDGLQATPGVGVIALGDYVVCGTPVAKGTALTVNPKVCKATAAANTLLFKYRVVSLGTAGTGAVGTTGVISFVG